MARTVSMFPNTDAALLGWFNNLVAKLSVAPTTYGVTSDDCVAMAALVSAFGTALAKCEPAIRSKSATTAKNSARAQAKTKAKLLASVVNGQANVTAAMKEALGLTVRKPPQPRPVPPVAPLMEVVNVNGWTVTAKLKSPDGRRGLYKDTAGISVFSHVGPTAPASMNDWQFETLTGRDTITVNFPSTLAAGTKVWLCAFYFNGRKDVGPSCAPQSSNLLGSGTVARAA